MVHEVGFRVNGVSKIADCVGSSLSGMFSMECLTKSLKLVDVSDVIIVTSSVTVVGAYCTLYESDVNAFHHFLVD